MNQYSPHQNVINYNAGGKQDRLLLGVILIVLGESLLVSMGAVIKHLSVTMPLPELLFFRNLLALLFIFPLVMRIGVSQLKTPNIGLHALRGIFGVSAMFCMFYAFSTIKLSEAILLKSMSPIFLSLMAWLVLREKLSGLTWLAIFLAFFGVVVIINPGGIAVSVQLGFVAGFISALLAAMAKIMIRKLGRTESSEVIIFYFAICGTLFSLPFALWSWQPISLVNWGFLLFIGLLATFGQLFITKAYTVAKAGKVSIFSYLSTPIAGLLGWFLWREAIDLRLILGSIIVIGAGALSFYAGQSSERKMRNSEGSK
ncbi:MAG: DMT family transporter [Acidiferrobacterales bacterium]|nr:DMT family transporter [Acidiferrobacterales bacterium]